MRSLCRGGSRSAFTSFVAAVPPRLQRLLQRNHLPQRVFGKGCPSSVETPRGASPGQRTSAMLTWTPPRVLCGNQDLPLRLGDAPRGVSTVGVPNGIATFQTPSQILLNPSPPGISPSYTHLCLQPAGRQELARRRKPRETRRFTIAQSPARGGRFSSTTPDLPTQRARTQWICVLRGVPVAPDGALERLKTLHSPGLTPPGYFLSPSGLDRDVYK